MRADDRPACDEALGLSLEENDVLPATGADRLHQPAADRELCAERSGHLGKRGRDEDRVIRCVCDEALAAVAHDNRRVRDAAAREVLPSGLGEVSPALDAPDLVRESPEQGRLPAEAGPDFEDALLAGQRQRLDHLGDERRLRGHLAVGNWNRDVEIGAISVARRDELASGNVTDGLEEPRLGDSRETHGGEKLDVVRAVRHGTILPGVTTWPTSADELVDVQLTLAEIGPPPWRLEDHSLIAGCFVCSSRAKRGHGAAGDPLWAAAAAAKDTAVIEAKAGAPYQSGLLALREGPALAAAVHALQRSPDALLVDGTGRDHPRRAGLAIQLGAVLGLPTVGVTHRPLLADGSWPDDKQGARAPLVLDAAVVGYWLRTRPGTRPLAVHAAWRTDPEAAVEIVLRALGGHRAPEPLRVARRAAREARSAAV